MNKPGNTTGKNMYEMKASDHQVQWICICRAVKPNHGNLQLVNILPMSKRIEEPSFDRLSFSQQSVKSVFQQKKTEHLSTNHKILSYLKSTLELINNHPSFS